jgi:hypothetical protein
VESQLEEDDWRTLAIISLEPEAGRSLVALNLALALALKERTVILVDADLRTLTGYPPTRPCSASTSAPRASIRACVAVGRPSCAPPPPRGCA